MLTNTITHFFRNVDSVYKFKLSLVNSRWDVVRRCYNTCMSVLSSMAIDFLLMKQLTSQNNNISLHVSFDEFHD